MKDATHHLDKRFSSLQALTKLQRPPKGWVRAIRDALGMTTSQYARRLGVSQPRVVELEKSEQNGNLTLNTLQRAAEALECRLVYVLIPEHPLEEIVSKRAKLVAELQSQAIEQTMKLEDQAVTDKRAARALRQQMVKELLHHPKRLWDDE
ncbi:MAG TPA: mobile mystery protein A [Bradyrhizobium sp.]|nr:mobile mystery protein A [Bradyrhizobium sp.]